MASSANSDVKERIYLIIDNLSILAAAEENEINVVVHDGKLSRIIVQDSSGSVNCVGETILQRLRNIVTAECDGSSNILGCCLAKSLTHINKKCVSSTIQSSPVISENAIESAEEASASRQFSDARIIILSFSTLISRTHNGSIINCLYACQRSMIPIDCVLLPPYKVWTNTFLLLNQISKLSGGNFYPLNTVDELPVCLLVWLTVPYRLPNFVSIPCQSSVNFGIGTESITSSQITNEAHICSCCLAVHLEIVPTCSVCKQDF